MKLDALAFGAHADDVELACSGTLIKLGLLNYKTGVVALTKGEMGTRGSVEIRAEEFAESGKSMGLAVQKMLDIPDARVEVTWENKLKIIQAIREYQPRIVFAPYWVTRHPDHEQTSRLVRESAYLAGLKKVDTGQEPHRPQQVIYYQEVFEFKPSFIVDISATHERKVQAIMAYKSQFHHRDKGDYGNAETPISTPEFLDRITNRDRHYGDMIGVEFAEPFLVRESMIVNDPVAYFGSEYLGVLS